MTAHYKIHNHKRFTPVCRRLLAMIKLTKTSLNSLLRDQNKIKETWGALEKRGFGWQHKCFSMDKYRENPVSIPLSVSKMSWLTERFTKPLDCLLPYKTASRGHSPIEDIWTFFSIHRNYTKQKPWTVEPADWWIALLMSTTFWIGSVSRRIHWFYDGNQIRKSYHKLCVQH